MRTFEIVNICERLVVVHVLLRAGIFVVFVVIHSLGLALRSRLRQVRSHT